MDQFFKTWVDTFIQVWAGRIDYIAYAIVGTWITLMGARWYGGAPPTFGDGIAALLGILAGPVIALILKLNRAKQQNKTQ